MQFNKLPVMQFYVFGCAMLGTMVATLGTGSAMSNKKKTGAKGAQYELPTWCDRLPESWKLWIMKRRYGNEEAAIEALKKIKEEKKFADTHFPDDRSKLNAKHFSVRAFLVRTSTSKCVRYDNRSR